MLLPLPPFPWNPTHPAKRCQSWTLPPQLKELFQAPPPTYFSKPAICGLPRLFTAVVFKPRISLSAQPLRVHAWSSCIIFWSINLSWFPPRAFPLFLPSSKRVASSLIHCLRAGPWQSKTRNLLYFPVCVSLTLNPLRRRRSACRSWRLGKSSKCRMGFPWAVARVWCAPREQQNYLVLF